MTADEGQTGRDAARPHQGRAHLNGHVGAWSPRQPQWQHCGRFWLHGVACASTCRWTGAGADAVGGCAREDGGQRGCECDAHGVRDGMVADVCGGGPEEGVRSASDRGVVVREGGRRLCAGDGVRSEARRRDAGRYKDASGVSCAGGWREGGGETGLLFMCSVVGPQA